MISANPIPQNPVYCRIDVCTPRIDESLREIVLGRFVGCDELRVKPAVERALGINSLKKCAAKDFCDADPT